MDSLIESSDTETMLIFFMAPLLFLFLLSRFLCGKPHPPGPKGLPLIGNMMMKKDQLTHRGLAKLAKQYGGIFRLKMGFLNIVAVSSPDIARQILQVHDNIFSNRPTTIAIRYLTYNQADMAFAPYGPFWRQMRKVCVMRLFSRKRTESWEAVRLEINDMIKTVASKTGSAVNLSELVFRLTRNITFRAAFGSTRRERQDEFIRILQEFSELFGAFNIADFIPWLTWVDPQGLSKRFVKARASLDLFIDTIIDDHVEKKTNENGCIDNERDMVDELLSYYSEFKYSNESENSQKSITLTRNNIKAIIMDIMFGGTETVASGIEWAMSELIKSPDDLKKVQQELNDVVGLHRKVEETDFDELTYYKCCLKEVLRLHPPIPTIHHQTFEDAEVGGYYIPAKSSVFINTWAIGRDKDSWEDADIFKPSRFLKDGMPDYKGSNFEFLPFGSGRRSCPGMQLGFYELELAVAHLLHCFTWDLPNGMKLGELDMDDKFGLAASRASPLIAVPTQRLHCSLYRKTASPLIAVPTQRLHCSLYPKILI
ncbi:hypothetical protein ACH5RR_011828 [Cinchona calisaya]|uniref:Cytochrome P450 84A1-like n=1 Tax=Cinchona calisaya TaxID=153742 RepID=A0ABD3A642_9GENT